MNYQNEIKTNYLTNGWIETLRLTDRWLTHIDSVEEKKEDTFTDFLHFIAYTFFLIGSGKSSLDKTKQYFQEIQKISYPNKLLERKVKVLEPPQPY